MNKILYIVLISLFSLTVFSCAKEEEKEAPVLTEVYPVTTPTDDPTPNYTFSSTKAGTITYGGSCSSGTTSATSGNNTITFVTLSAGTYSNCTIIVTDSDGNASNTLAITSFTVTETPDCCSTGSATIQGTVEDNASEALSGVSVIFAKFGTASSTVTTVDNGTFSKSSLSSGTYTLTFTKSGFVDASLSATLTADNETLEVGIVQLFADTSCASTGTISGTIKDAVSNSGVANVSLSARSGIDTTSGTIVQTTTSDVSGNYSLSSMSTGWYTIQTSKSGYMATTFNVFACGDQSEQNGSISTTLSSGSLRIVLSWESNVDLDAHLTGPDNASGRFHVYYVQKRFHYDINTYSSSRSSSDNVTQDTDSVQGREGPETITVSAVRSGTYRYYVHNFDNAGRPNSMRLYKSKASVKVYHSSLSGGVTKFKAPNKPGDLWTVFEFNLSSGVTRIRTVGSESSSPNVDNHGSSLDTTAPTVTSVSTTADNQSAVSITDNITVTFSEAMDYTSITTNTDNTSCYGTLMVSSDNFSTCVRMASPNKALDFDGTNDYVAVSNPSSIPVGIESYTIEAWFYADQMGTRGIVGWGNYGSYNQVTALRLHGSNGLRHYWWGNDLDVTTGDISGAWHHVAVTWDGTDRKLYLDGVFKKGDQPSGHAVPNASNFRIGSTNNGEYFDGKIDEIRIWSEARTQPEIQATMNNTLTGSESGLVAYYKMNDGSGTSLADSSSNSNTATLNNMTDSDWIQGNASFSDSPSNMTFTLDPSDNLTGGTTYLARVTTGVKDAAGNAMSSQYETSSGFSTLLPAPENLSVSGANNTITLTWNSVSGATSYTLYWDNVSGIDSSDTAITSITNVNYTHSNMNNGSTYYYKVAAVNSSGTGTLSSVASAVLSADIQGSETNEGHTYALTSTTKSWSDAATAAAAVGGYLTTVNTKAENTWLYNKFGNFGGTARDLWIGSKDNVTEGSWYWYNGTTSGDGGVTDNISSGAKWPDGTDKWASGEPNDSGTEDCGSIRGSINTEKWNDYSCTNTYYGIIEID